MFTFDWNVLQGFPLKYRNAKTAKLESEYKPLPVTTIAKSQANI